MRFLRDVPQRRLVDARGRLRRDDLAAAEMLEHRQRVQEPRVQRRVRRVARENPVRREREVLVVALVAVESGVEPGCHTLLQFVPASYPRYVVTLSTIWTSHPLTW